MQETSYHTEGIIGQNGWVPCGKSRHGRGCGGSNGRGGRELEGWVGFIDGLAEVSGECFCSYTDRQLVPWTGYARTRTDVGIQHHCRSEPDRTMCCPCYRDRTGIPDHSAQWDILGPMKRNLAAQGGVSVEKGMALGFMMLTEHCG